MIAASALIHKWAEVDPDVSIGARTRVWQFASIIRNANIGEDCSIASCAIVDGATIGDRSIISHDAFMDPGIVVGRDVFIGPGFIGCNDAWPAVNKKGMDYNALISREFVTIRIGDGSIIGAGVVVLPGIVIGEDAMVAAGCVVDRNIPPGFLLKRGGTMVMIDRLKLPNRMREARIS